MKTLSWDKIQQGDEEAFRQLYEQYADLLYGYGMKIVNELKKENSGSFKSLDEVGTNEYQFDLEIDIETAIIHSELEKEQLEVLQKELNNLTKQQREVLYLKYYKKMSPEEIAQVMGLTSRTVYNTTHMAISSLRERMSKSFLLLVAANLWIFN